MIRKALTICTLVAALALPGCGDKATTVTPPSQKPVPVQVTGYHFNFDTPDAGSTPPPPTVPTVSGYHFPSTSGTPDAGASPAPTITVQGYFTGSK